MKKTLLSFLSVALLTLSSAHAGQIKEVVIEAEDAIYHEFFQNDREVLEISNQELVSSKAGVGVKATVVTKNPFNGYIQTWTCVVDLKKDGRSFTAVDVNCN